MLKYIIPFLAILIGMLLPIFGINQFLAYSLRVILGLAAIIYFWKRYKEIKVKFDPFAWVFGLIITIVWLSLEFLNKGNTAGYNPTIYTGALFYILILIKLIGIIIVAAVIEEIFMRSFLIRLFINTNFQKVKIGKFTWFSFIASTLIFGFMHGSTITGSRLIAGLASGILFNLWLYYRKDIFSCIQCHAAANLFLAVYVLTTQNWFLW